MFCEECGARLSEGTKYCPQCGTMQEDLEVEKDELSELSQTIQEKEMVEVDEPIETNVKSQVDEFIEQGETNEPDRSIQQDQAIQVEETSEEVQISEITQQQEVAATVEVQPPIRAKKAVLKWVVGILVAIIFVSVLTVGSFMVYILGFEYENKQSVDVYEYLQNNKQATQLLADRTIEVRISDQVFNNILINNKDAIEQQLGVVIDSIFMNTKEERVYINTVSEVMKFPISAEARVRIRDENVRLELDNFRCGAKNIKLPNFIYKLFIGSSYVRVDINMQIPTILTIDDIQIEDDEVRMIFAYNYNGLSEVAKNLVQYIDEAALETYRGKTDIQNCIYRIFSQSYGMSNPNELQSELRNLIDYMTQGSGLPEILAILNDQGISYLQSNYNLFIDTKALGQRIQEIKKEIILAKIANEASEVFDAVDRYNYMENAYYISSQGKLYDYLQQEVITPKLLKEKGYLTDSTTFDTSYIVYNDFGDNILIYANEGQFIEIYSNGRYTILTEQEYRNQYSYIEAEYGEGVLLAEGDPARTQIIRAIKEYNYSTEDYFVRYLKADDRYAFAIVSSSSEYQQVEQYLLELVDNQWVALEKYRYDENLGDGIGRRYTQVNMDILPPYIVRVTNFENISGTAYVIRYLIENGYISSPNGYEQEGGETVVYASHVDNHAYIKTSSGKEFLLVIYYYQIEAVYEIKTPADLDSLKNQYDIPEIICLQK